MDVRHVPTIRKPIEWFKDNPENYQSHEENVGDLEDSLLRFGELKNVVAKPDGTLLAGHGIIEAARKAGATEFDVKVFEGSEEDALGFMVADNEIARAARRDKGQLVKVLEDLAEGDGEGLKGIGIDDDGLAALIAELEAERVKAPVVEVPVPDAPKEATTKLGDVWLLGEHRVVCGDCTEEHVVAGLFGDERARMVWTDPPYGVDYATKVEHLNEADGGNRNQTPIKHDAMDEAATEALCRDALTLAAAFGKQGASCYVACPSGTPLPHFIAAVAASGFTFKHSLAWVKQQFVFGRCDYHYRHETILYGWKPDGAHYFVDDHTHDSVFEVDKPHRSEEHPTMKPVALVAQMVDNSSRIGEVVYDPFMGSGSTLLACEQLQRRAYGCEIAERYCDVAIRRWQDLTNQQATLESTGEPFVASET